MQVADTVNFLSRVGMLFTNSVWPSNVGILSKQMDIIVTLFKHSSRVFTIVFFLSQPSLQKVQWTPFTGKLNKGMGKFCNFIPKSPFISETVRHIFMVTMDHKRNNTHRSGKGTRITRQCRDSNGNFGHVARQNSLAEDIMLGPMPGKRRQEARRSND